MIVIYRVNDNDWKRKEFPDHYSEGQIVELLAEGYAFKSCEWLDVEIDIVHRCHFTRYNVEVEFTPCFTA